MLKLKGNHKGSAATLRINPAHITLCFMRQKKVILRLIDGIEIALDDSYADAKTVEKLIDAALQKQNATSIPEGFDDFLKSLFPPQNDEPFQDVGAIPPLNDPEPSSGTPETIDAEFDDESDEEDDADDEG